MPFDADDLAAMVDADMPSHAVATLAGGAEVNGRFRRPPAEVYGVSGVRPTFTASSGDLASLESGDQLSIGGTAFVVARPELLDTGETRLHLEAT